MAALRSTTSPHKALGVVISRKNYLLAGSDAGGRRAAAMGSLIETAKLNGINPRRYLAHVPPASPITQRATSPNCSRGTGSRSSPPGPPPDPASSPSTYPPCCPASTSRSSPCPKDPRTPYFLLHRAISILVAHDIRYPQHNASEQRKSVEFEYTSICLIFNMHLAMAPLLFQKLLRCWVW
jgi:hypothetical protein